MASDNPTEDLPAATNTSNIPRRQHRGRRIAATLVTCTLLGGTAIAITASSASAMPNDRCGSITAVYEDEITYAQDLHDEWINELQTYQWMDAAVTYKFYQAAYAEAQTDFHAMQAACE